MKFRLPTSRFGRLFLCLSLVQAVVIIVLESVVSATILPYINVSDINDLNRGVPVYVLIFVTSQLWNIVLAWEAVLKENTIQLISYVLFNVATFVYSIFQYSQVAHDNSGLQPILAIIPAIIGVCTLLHAFLAYKLYLEFGWRIYKRIGADPNMKNMFRSYQVFLTLLKVDVFFWFSFSVQYLVLVLERNDSEWGITIAALPATAALLFIAVYGLKRENRTVMIIFIVGLMFGIAYFLFKIIRVWTTTRTRLANTQNYLTFFAALSLVMLVLTLINSVACLMNFGKGLKSHISKTSTTPAPVGNHMNLNSPNAPPSVDSRL